MKTDSTSLMVMPGHKALTVYRQTADNQLQIESDDIAEEIPVVLEYNGLSHAVVLATPSDLEDFARGFSLTEGIVRSMDDIYAIELSSQDDGIILQLTIAGACLHRLQQRRRTMAGRSGCGLCGVESLEEVYRQIPSLPARQGFIQAKSVVSALQHLADHQPLRRQTGATHGAAWVTLDGEIGFVREDVGRHNALDKVIGQLHVVGTDPAEGFVVISSRASFEIIQKAAAAGISAVVAMSAPTSLAVRLATELNIMLAGFARGEQFTVYSHPKYLKPQVLCEKLDVDNFSKALTGSTRYLIVYFSASWCLPCQAMRPVFMQLAEELYTDDVDFGEVDMATSPTLAQRYGVRSVPSVVIFKKGGLVKVISGEVPFSELLRRVEGVMMG